MKEVKSHTENIEEVDVVVRNSLDLYSGDSTILESLPEHGLFLPRFFVGFNSPSNQISS
jgi:hypothetical protein